MNKDERLEEVFSCMLSILDSLKLHDKESLCDDETLSEMMFRKMGAYNIDLNKELGFTHLKPVTKDWKDVILDMTKDEPLGGIFKEPEDE
jgi:hypothetical protein